MCSVITLRTKVSPKDAPLPFAVARTMDFNFSFVGRAHAVIEANKNVTVNGNAFTTTKKVKTICNFKYPAEIDKKDFLIWQEAINEDGLSFSLLYNIDNTVLTKASPLSVDAITWPAYMVATKSTVAEVVDAVSNVIFHMNGVEAKMATCHFYFTDATGRSIVIEMHNGRPSVYEAPLEVMTNGPEYSWHMTNLRNYLNVSPKGVEEATWPNTTIGTPYNYGKIGHGDGFLGVPGGNGSPDRFVRLALNKMNMTNVTKDNIVAKAVELIGLGHTLEGTQSGGGGVDQTLWTSVKYYTDKNNFGLKVRDLGSIDFNEVVRDGVHA